jgi:hypothetical protein
MTNPQNLQFHKDIVSAIERCGGWEKFKIERHRDNYKNCIEIEQKAINYDPKSLITDSVKNEDNERGSLFVGISKITSGNLYHYDTKFVEAAKRIELSWRNHGRVNKLSLSGETAALSSIIAKLEGELKDDVELLGLSGWITELKKKNLSVEKLMSNRDDESAAKFDVPMKEARINSDKAFKSTIKLLDNLIILDMQTEGTDVLCKIIEEIAERNK